MALQPKDYMKQERMQPGFDGQRFGVNMPGARDSKADRINRTNNYMNTSEHDVLNIKYMLDHRLPVLFKYGFAYGYNQIVLPKGRIVAVDPYMDRVDFESGKKFSVLTLANGGVPVRPRLAGDKYYAAKSDGTGMVSPALAGKAIPDKGDNHEWAPIAGLAELYSDKEGFRPFKTDKGNKAHLDKKNLKVAADTGLIRLDGGLLLEEQGQRVEVRPGNVPVGIIERNEYTRDDDAYNGMAPGPVLTDALIELPWFAYKDKAEQNPWGSAYGHLRPGMLVRSDENGRFVPSILNFPEEMAGMDVQEYELERQQVIGQVYAVNTELVPEGAAKWATWALEDRLNNEAFNPAVYAKTNRRGEDAVNNSPFKSTGAYPGYPYDKNFLNHDLHMLASDRMGMYDPRMNPEFEYNNLGIPGLTDGKNVFSEQVEDVVVGTIHGTADLGNGEHAPFQEVFFRLPDVNIVANTLQIKLGEAPGTGVDAAGNRNVDLALAGVVLKDNFKVNYVNEAQGIVSIVAKENTKDTLAKIAEAAKDGLQVRVSYKKAGLAGVPTFMDWDGAVGSVKILLTK